MEKREVELPIDKLLPLLWQTFPLLSESIVRDTTHCAMKRQNAASSSSLEEAKENHKKKSLVVSKQKKCCICHEDIVIPLALCSHNHLACAHCVASFAFVLTIEFPENVHQLYIPRIKRKKADEARCPLCHETVVILPVAVSGDKAACIYCNQLFDPMALGLHILQCEKLPRVCPQCDKEDTDLNTHLRRDCKQFACDVVDCCSRFAWSDRRTHARMHVKLETLRSKMLDLICHSQKFTNVENATSLEALFEQIQRTV